MQLVESLNKNGMYQAKMLPDVENMAVLNLYKVPGIGSIDIYKDNELYSIRVCYGPVYEGSADVYRVTNAFLDYLANEITNHNALYEPIKAIPLTMVSGGGLFCSATGLSIDQAYTIITLWISTLRMMNDNKDYVCYSGLLH